MTTEQFETIYDALANAIDAAGPELGEVYLAKVALALAETLDDPALALKVIAECREGL
ncbi:MAG: DUF2783 domain-containing protein [Phyllobacteriaceae bacterium]|uniref:hypothetical protein n=1 Tax=Zhengella sedimenti TaxID=3390035 RepID=UPI000C4811C9|nr:DUF2783 domain-containing protein [Phyllobacteriaceae bacterium]MBA91549.1 DUF2783 domain-containing protein [Phyllobacteriaceae bacterium]